MELRRPYAVALAGAVLADGAAIGLHELDKASERRIASENAAFEAKRLALTERTNALVAKLPTPTGFRDGGADCKGGVQEDACFVATQEPRVALDSFLAAVRPLGLSVRQQECRVGSLPAERVTRLFGNTPPCSAFGELDGVPYSMSAFPLRDTNRSTPGHEVFRGSRVTITFINA